MGQTHTSIKDGTAQGIAKVRHYESLHEPSRRLYLDPYAYAMYPGSFVQAWLGEGTTHWLWNAFGLKGMLEMIGIRTKWIDDAIMKAVKVASPSSSSSAAAAAAAAQQLVILGAGYDTRGFRLNLPQQQGDDNFCVFEVDQPGVQAKKVSILENLSKSDAVVAARMQSSFVKFVPVDFNVDSIDEKLQNTDGYSVDKQTVVTLEGVTQYIPKSSTADTLTKLKKVLAPGSTLLVTYVDQNLFDDPSKYGPPQVIERILGMVRKAGEPWISAWSMDEFRSFLDDMGYQVVSDTTARDYMDEYLVPLHRGLSEDEILSMERFVVAKVRA